MKTGLRAFIERLLSPFQRKSFYGGTGDESRNERTSFGLERLVKDARFVARSLFRSPAYSLTVVGTLFAGIGTAAIIFTISERVLFRAPPYPDAGQLVRFATTDKQGQYVPIVNGMYFRAIQEQTSVFSEFAAVSWELNNVAVENDPEAIYVGRVSEDFLHTFGAVPQLGRGFLADDFAARNEDILLISDHYWRQRFDRDPDIVGREIRIGDTPCLIVGVLAAGQQFPTGFSGDLFRPLVFTVDPVNPFSPSLITVGRLKPGIPSADALQAMAGVTLDPSLPRWAVQYFGAREPVLSDPNQVDRPEVWWVLFIAGLFLFFVASLNAMNLTLVRVLGRSRELSIRLAIGGTRGQIAVLLVIESVVLVGIACGAVAFAGHALFPTILDFVNGDNTDTLLDWITADADTPNSLSWGWRSLVVVAGLGMVACALIILVPAARVLRPHIQEGLREGGAALGESLRMGRLRNSLVIMQAACAVVLLVGTGLMMRTFQQLRQVDLGFDPSAVVRADILFPRHYNPEREERLQLFQRLEARVATLPGVTAASYGQNSLLMGGFFGTAELKMPDGSFIPVAGNFVPASFREAAGLTVIKGQWLSDDRGPFKAVINEAMAQVRFGDKDPIGQFFQIQVSGDAAYEVVGVVRNVHNTVRDQPGIKFYVPAWMYPPNLSSLVMRTGHEPDPHFADLVRKAVHEVQPDLIIAGINSMQSWVDRSLVVEEMVYRVLQGVATIALVLAMVGLFSVISHTVHNRMTEFGVRMALGAMPRNLIGMVLKRGLIMSGLGILLGTLVALGLTRFLQSLLFQTAPYEPAVYLSVATVLLIAAGAACWLPALRSTRVDISKLLRVE